MTVTRLYLMRHAIAVPRGTPGFLHDPQRPLTDEGEAQAHDVAEGLRRLKIPLDVIVTSPLLRATQTAQRVAKVFDLDPLKEMAALRPEAKPSDTSQALKEFASHKHVLLVGHEPHISAWLAELVSGPDGLQCLFKKAGVACVEIERVPPPRGSGTLRWLLTPKQLILIGR